MYSSILSPKTNRHHCVFATEYLYAHICDDYTKRKLITVYDLAGANLGDLKGEAKIFLRKGLGLVQQHYPEVSTPARPPLPLRSHHFPIPCDPAHPPTRSPNRDRA